MKLILNLLLFICSTFAVSTLNAQQDWDFEWTQHNIVFTLAEDFKVVSNSADEFTAKGDGMDFGIFPFDDHTVDQTDMISYTLAIAKSLSMEQLDDVDVIEMNGLKGSYVEGYKDGQRIITLGFIDPESGTNFFAFITFADNDKVAEDEAVRMITSLRKK
ncbi:MAG: hypothetical protein IPO72_05950 [Saprospiraceae bacterium]|nr:hypothetical protein [Candidatus Vicinibacter affinis]MBK7303069.1 hypothetical protein [Candidatus Vicinibacter affinis]MBK9640841.1 hypothetical protein [Candidatus Vicinibacter affinis]